ncbi:hypothetical protein Dimus_000111 [Dionaea muscipula]
MEEGIYPRPLNIHWVATVDSPEFALLSWALAQSSIIALDAEWKPRRTHQQETNPCTFPVVTLLQLACRLRPRLVDLPPGSGDATLLSPDDSLVFLVDLQSIPLNSVYGQLREMFVCPDVLKLGFRFKQDLVYLSSTFCSHGCDPGFDRVEPFMDITSMHTALQQRQIGRRALKESKSLAIISQELLGISLAKEFQCSDWSRRPLTEEQKIYAAADAHCLLEIFSVFQARTAKEEGNVDERDSPNLRLGLTIILEKPTVTERIIHNKFFEASDLVRAAAASDLLKSLPSTNCIETDSFCRKSINLDDSLLKIIQSYGSKILLQESDRKPRSSKKKTRRQPRFCLNAEVKHLESVDDWLGPPPWDRLLGGDGYPKFLCDIMVEGLAKHLRCVGVDAAIPHSKKPESRQLIDQAQREKRVLLTRDAKLLRHGYLIRNQIYRVKSLLKNDQLLEVIEIFQLKISEDQLMSRCTKCNGRFIQRPLSTEEAVEAAKGFQKIPDCLFDKNLEFWQCMDCHQLYWEGTRYHNAVQKFIDVCKLNE